MTRKLIYSMLASLDGYIADEDGKFDWAVPDDEVHSFINDLERPVDTYLYGRRMYATMVAFNPLFLVYVAIFALSAVAFFLNLGGIEVSRLPMHISERFPRWLFIVFTLVMSAALIVLWLGRIIPYTLAGRFPDELAGLTTLVTQAFDLGMVVPLLLSTAILLWRRSTWGYLLGSVSLTFGFVMCITLPAWIVVPLIQTGQMNLIEAVPFLLLCLIGLFVAGWFFWSVQEKEIAYSRGEMVPV